MVATKISPQHKGERATSVNSNLKLLYIAQCVKLYYINNSTNNSIVKVVKVALFSFIFIWIYLKDRARKLILPFFNTFTIENNLNI